MVALFVAALTSLPPSPAQAGTDIPLGSPINLDIADVHLEDLLATLSDVTDLVFAMDARTAESGALDLRISAIYESTPWDGALDEILREAGLEWTLEATVLWIHLPADTPAGDRNFTGEPINLRLEDAKLVDVLDTMSKLTGMEIDFDPEIEATVSVRLLEIPWDQVLDLVLRISGFDFAQKDDAFEVFKVSDATGMQFGVGHRE
jgi:type IV pilus assembly protein PilQ